MKTEVRCACDFISRMLQTRNLPVQFIKPFRRRLEELLVERFTDHWDPQNPNKGSAYRCIRINNRMDPVVKEAAKVTGLSDISRYLPAEFTMWIDPRDVSYRFGEDGSICSCPVTDVHSDVWTSTAATTISTNTATVAHSGTGSASNGSGKHSRYYANMYRGLAPTHVDYAISVQVWSNPLIHFHPASVHTDFFKISGLKLDNALPTILYLFLLPFLLTCKFFAPHWLCVYIYRFSLLIIPHQYIMFTAVGVLCAYNKITKKRFHHRWNVNWVLLYCNGGGGERYPCGWSHANELCGMWECWFSNINVDITDKRSPVLPLG